MTPWRAPTFRLRTTGLNYRPVYKVRNQNCELNGVSTSSTTVLLTCQINSGLVSYCTVGSRRTTSPFSADCRCSSCQTSVNMHKLWFHWKRRLFFFVDWGNMSVPSQTWKQSIDFLISKNVPWHFFVVKCFTSHFSVYVNNHFNRLSETLKLSLFLEEMVFLINVYSCWEAW